MLSGNGERDRAVLLALVATFICLVVGRILLGFFWVVALGAAILLFTLFLAFFLRAQRNRR